MARLTAPAASTEDPQVTADLFLCPNCDTTTPGPFCCHCGQKRPVVSDLSLRHAGRYVVEELLNLDGRRLTNGEAALHPAVAADAGFLRGTPRAPRPPATPLPRVQRRLLPRARLDDDDSVRQWSGSPRHVEHARAGAGGRRAVRDGGRAERSAARARVQSTFIVGTLLTGVWLWLFFRRDYPYLAQHMVVALHFSCIAMAAVVTADVVQLAMRSGPRNPTALGGGRLGASLIGPYDLLFPGPDDHPGLPAREERRDRSACDGAVALLVIMSAMMLPVFASSRYLQSSCDRPSLTTYHADLTLRSQNAEDLDRYHPC